MKFNDYNLEFHGQALAQIAVHQGYELTTNLFPNKQSHPCNNNKKCCSHFGQLLLSTTTKENKATFSHTDPISWWYEVAKDGGFDGQWPL